MKCITKWTARRAGGRITINGWEQAEGEKVGHSIKIVGVDTIEAGKDGGNPVATDKDGERYELA
jgi:hypothetical protein